MVERTGYYAVELLAREIHNDATGPPKRTEDLLPPRSDPGMAYKERPLFEKDVSDDAILDLTELTSNRVSII
jgi:hypothetical protein